MGRWIIKLPDALMEFPDAFVLVSSFRSLNAVAAKLAVRFVRNVILMYDK